ncbi:MAG TPA: HAD-IA family hydrolase [bacterium]|nr:HAD-IA family hydrolase [bacterium]
MTQGQLIGVPRGGNSQLGPARRYRAVLFDLDGTLLDSAELILAAFQATVRAHLHREIPRAEVFDMWSRPIRERFHVLAPDRDELLTQDYLRRYLALHDRYARLFPGIPGLLETLKQSGFAMGIVTSKRRSTAMASVASFRLNRWCPVVVVDEDVRRHKPDPESVRLAAARLDVPTATSLMVGDSPLDIAAGHAAGAGTAAALWGTVDAPQLLAASPDHRLTRPDDLLSFCRPG